MKDFGTSLSPKSTRLRDSRYCPGRPASVPLRHTIASSAQAPQHSHNGLTAFRMRLHMLSAGYGTCGPFAKPRGAKRSGHCKPPPDKRATELRREVATASLTAVGSWGWRIWLTYVNRCRAVVIGNMPKRLIGMNQKVSSQVGGASSSPAQVVHCRR